MEHASRLHENERHAHFALFAKRFLPGFSCFASGAAKMAAVREQGRAKMVAVRALFVEAYVLVA